MNKIQLALASLIAFATLLFTNVAHADVFCPAGGTCGHGGGGGGGGGCSIAADHPGALAVLMITVGIVTLAIGRRRKA